MKMTPWFPGHVKPFHKGVYRRKSPYALKPIYSHWNGRRWGVYMGTPLRALVQGFTPSNYQSLSWCGLTSKDGK